jgi:hypothetical protein
MIKFLFSFILLFPFCTKAQTLVTGKITHAFNTNAEGKADAGSKIYLLKYEGDVVALYTSITNFLAVKKMRNLNNDVNRLISIYKDSASEIKSQKKYEAKYIGYQNMIAKIKADEAERMALLQSMDAETNAKFDILDKRAAKELSQTKLRSFESRVVADAEGNFSYKDKPSGKYIILFISNNRTGFSATEASGKIFVKEINIKDSETVHVDNTFVPD